MRSQVETLFIERSLTKYLFLRAFGYQSIAFDGLRNDDLISVDVYRKPTHTDRYLNYLSHHD